MGRALDPKLEGQLDFVISSDVFEHVPPPVDIAFENTRRMLRPGGLFVLEGYTPAQLEYKTGGPGVVENLYTEDWVRSTADPIEVRSRIERLRAAHEHQHRRPTVDEDGILTFGERWVALAPGDVALARVLCEQFTNLVAREDLRRCAVPPCSDATLAVKLYRLRRHLTQVGLRLTTIRSRGCILESAQAAQPTVESVG